MISILLWKYMYEKDNDQFRSHGDYLGLMTYSPNSVMFYDKHMDYRFVMLQWGAVTSSSTLQWQVAQITILLDQVPLSFYDWLRSQSMRGDIISLSSLLTNSNQCVGGYHWEHISNSLNISRHSINANVIDAICLVSSDKDMISTQYQTLSGKMKRTL